MNPATIIYNNIFRPCGDLDVGLFLGDLRKVMDKHNITAILPREDVEPGIAYGIHDEFLDKGFAFVFQGMEIK